MKTIIYILLFITVLSSCKKDYSEPNPQYISPTRDINYQVIVTQKATVNIWCAANDKSSLLPDGSIQYFNATDYFYFNQHVTVKKGDKYYLKAYYNNHIRPEYNYLVRVLCDGTIIASTRVAFNQINPDSSVTFLADTFAKYQTIVFEGVVPN